MKYICILILTACLCSCGEGNLEHKAEHKPIEYIEQYCPNCNGVGKVKLTTEDKLIWGLVTFGAGFTFETFDCDMCKGTGVIKKRKLNN